MNQAQPEETDILVIGGGQSALAVGYFLRRTNCSFVMLDATPEPGGAWTQGWESLRLFSPADASSLPGWPMPRLNAEITDFPDRQHVIDYLARYEARYTLPIRRPIRVEQVTRADGRYTVQTDTGRWKANAVISATGSFSKPYIPAYKGLADFRGVQLHSAQYHSATSFEGKRVLVVGGGNSGAQILAEVSRVAQTVWVTLQPPTFLPDEVDGRVLFSRASAQYQASQSGEVPKPSRNLGDIVMVPSVREARSRGVLHAERPFEALTKEGVRWPGGLIDPFDAIIWCTGFRPATDHLRPLGIVDTQGRIATEGTKAIHSPGLWLVGYGSWTGFASATLIGVGRSARMTADQVNTYLQQMVAPLRHD